MNELENSRPLLGKVSLLIDTAQDYVSKAINKGMVLLYWQIGKTIQEDIITNEKPEYGQQVIQTLAAHLTREYGKGYSYRNLYRMLRFYEYFPDENILTTLLSKLSWSHIIHILGLKEEVKREFYITLCGNEGWSVRELADRIDSMLYERTAISKKPEETIYNDLKLLRETKEMSLDLFLKDPYLLDFLGLKDTYTEHDFETSILAQLQNFILEFGNDFAFLSRQKRITIGDEDFYIDLLFYHRKLKRLIVIELKLGKFKPEYKGQLELYLRWLDKYEKQEGEIAPLGILLCAEKSDEMVELLELGASGIHVATYFTELPPKEWLKQKLQTAVEVSRNKMTAIGEE